jgi:ferrochelatase
MELSQGHTVISAFQPPATTISSFATSSISRQGTGVLMLNLGGPATLSDVYPFLLRLFSDREIIKLPAQQWMSKWIARRRTPKVQKHYELIGGGSPIRKWTELQGTLLVKELDRLSPETAPHKYYIAFRYANPLTSEALEQISKDQPQRVVVFTQYPQYSCTTTGSSLNELYRQLQQRRELMQLRWSLIDRWYTNSLFINAVANKVRAGLEQFDPSVRDDVVLVFSAHSIPHYVVDRGDPYPQEVAATVHLVMQALGFSQRYCLAWQSKVGPLPWLGPPTERTLLGLAQKGIHHVLLVPIAFTSDHIETLYELDIEYAERARRVGLNVKRAESLNADPLFISALADIVRTHLRTPSVSKQFTFRCSNCDNEDCRASKTLFMSISSQTR